MRKSLAKLGAVVGTGALTLFVGASHALAASSSLTTTSDVAGAGLGLGMTIFWVCCGGLMLVVWIGLAIWVYKDATKKNVDNPILWALLTFFFGIIVFLIYILAIRNKGKQAAPQAPQA